MISDEHSLVRSIIFIFFSLVFNAFIMVCYMFCTVS